MTDLDLRRHLKQARAKTREPIACTAFTVVSALVREYNLDISFLAQLRDFSLPGVAWLQTLDLKAKDPFEAPPFSLAATPEYRLTQQILAAAHNPYLRFAHSPEELLLSRPLFRLNPDLEPATLARVHFRTLVAREILRKELTHLKRLGKAAADPDPSSTWESLLHRLTAIIDNK